MFIQLFPLVWIFLRSLEAIYFDRWVLSEGHKSYVLVLPLFDSMTVLSKACKPDNLNHTTLWNLAFFQYSKNLSKHSSSFETNLDDSVDSGNFSSIGYLLLICKDCVTPMDDLVVYVKEELLFAWDLSLESYQGSYYCFWLALLIQCLTSFSSSNHVFFLPISPSAIVFVFRDLRTG